MKHLDYEINLPSQSNIGYVENLKRTSSGAIKREVLSERNVHLNNKIIPGNNLILFKLIDNI